MNSCVNSGSYCVQYCVLAPYLLLLTLIWVLKLQNTDNSEVLSIYFLYAMKTCTSSLATGEDKVTGMFIEMVDVDRGVHALVISTVKYKRNVSQHDQHFGWLCVG